MRIYRDDLEKRYWSKVRNGGSVRFITLRGFLIAIILGFIFHPKFATWDGIRWLFDSVLWLSASFALAAGLWFLCLSGGKLSEKRSSP